MLQRKPIQKNCEKLLKNSIKLMKKLYYVYPSCNFICIQNLEFTKSCNKRFIGNSRNAAFIGGMTKQSKVHPPKSIKVSGTLKV